MYAAFTFACARAAAAADEHGAAQHHQKRQGERAVPKELPNGIVRHLRSHECGHGDGSSGVDYSAFCRLLHSSGEAAPSRAFGGVARR